MPLIRSWHPAFDMLILRDVPENGRAHGNDATAAPTSRRPFFDLYETAEGLTLRGWLPGARPDGIDVSFEKGALSVEAAIAEPDVPSEGVTWRRRELGSGRWALKLSIGEQFNPEAADATFENGVLTLRLPKAEAARPRTIQVRAGA